MEVQFRSDAVKTFKKGVKGLLDEQLRGEGLQVLIVHARWNLEIVDALTEKAIETLKYHGVRAADITTKQVPGSFELPIALNTLIKQSPRAYDVAIAIGVLIKGKTMHFEYISDAATHGLMKVSLDTGVPVVFGILTCLTDEQAMQRAGLAPGMHNHGEDWGKAAIEMAKMYRPQH